MYVCMYAMNLERSIENMIVCIHVSVYMYPYIEYIHTYIHTHTGLDPKKHFSCVTGKGSPMDNPSEYLKSFYMFDYIG